MKRVLGTVTKLIASSGGAIVSRQDGGGDVVLDCLQAFRIAGGGPLVLRLVLEFEIVVDRGTAFANDAITLKERARRIAAKPNIL